MNHYIIAQLLTSFVTPFLAAIVYFKNSKGSANRIFALHNLAIAVWSFGFYRMVIAQNEIEGLFWARFLHIGAVLIPSTFLHFIFIILGMAKRKRKIITICYLASILFLLLLPTNLFINHVVSRVGIKYFVGPAGFFYHTFPLFFFICVIYVFRELYKGLKSTQGPKRNQLRYLFFAYLIGYGGGQGGFYPLYNIHIPYWSLYTLTIYVGIITYAIIKYRLMDINFVLSRSIAYALLLLSSSAIYGGIIIASDKIFAVSPWYRPAVTHITIFFLMALGFIYCIPYIKSRTERVVEMALFKDKYLYRDELRDFGTKISFSISKKELLSTTANFISSTMQAPHLLMVLRNESYDHYVPEAWTGFSDEEIKALRFDEDSALIKWLAENKGLLIREELAQIEDSDTRKAIEIEMGKIKAYLCIPLSVSAHFIGFLSISDRSDGEMYSHIDIGLLQNITNEISLVIAYKQLEQHAFETEKLASLGTLAAGFAHEIRNPLSSIQTFAQLLPQKYSDEKFREEFAPLVVRDVQRITNLINNVLSLSKTRPPEMVFCDINEIIEETLSLLASEVKKNKIQIIKSYTNLSSVKGSKEQLKQVFLNIILNSIQAMPNGGTLKIESSLVSSLSEENERRYYARVRIQDTGPGIEEHALKKLFDPFFTTKPQGTGLGLALAHRIVEQHSGYIGVSSDVGKGVAFWVDLPVTEIG